MIERKPMLSASIKLDSKSREVLEKIASEICYKNNVHYDKKHNDHITLAFGDGEADEHFYDILGKKAEKIGIQSIIFNDKCMCAVIPYRYSVILKNEFFCKRVYPHITLRTDQYTRPVYSNALIEEFVEGTRGFTGAEAAISSIDLFDVYVSGTVEILNKDYTVTC